MDTFPPVVSGTWGSSTVVTSPELCHPALYESIHKDNWFRFGLDASDTLRGFCLLPTRQSPAAPREISLARQSGGCVYPRSVT